MKNLTENFGYIATLSETDRVAREIRAKVNEIPFSQWRNSEGNDIAIIRGLKEYACRQAESFKNNVEGFHQSEFLTKCGF